MDGQEQDDRKKRDSSEVADAAAGSDGGDEGLGAGHAGSSGTNGHQDKKRKLEEDARKDGNGDSNNNNDGTNDKTETVRWKLVNVGNNVWKKDVAALLKENGIEFRKVIKHAPKKFAYIDFESVESAEKAKVALEGVTNKKDEPYQLVEWVQQNNERIEKTKNANEPNIVKTANESTAPWSHIPYEEQLRLKSDKIVKALRRFPRMLVKAESKTQPPTPPPQWLLDRGGMGKVKEFMRKFDKQKQNEKQDREKRDGNKDNAPDATSSSSSSSSNSSSSSSSTDQKGRMKTEEKETAQRMDVDPKEEKKEEEKEKNSPAEKETKEESKKDEAKELNYDKVKEGKILSGDVGGAACYLEEILASPENVGYRNKCEFTIGIDADGKTTAGFRLGNFKGGSTTVGNCKDCVIVPQVMKSFVSKFEEFLETSELEPYNMHKHTGFWRTVTLRYFESTKSLMALFIVSPNTTKVTDVAAEIKSLVEFLAPKDGPSVFEGAELKSLSVSKFGGVSLPPPANHPYEIVYGEPQIFDVMNGLKFGVAPNAFFQVNSKAAEQLFLKVSQWSLAKGDEDDTSAGAGSDSTNNKGKKSCLLDVCCGTGSIGLTMAQHYTNVVGVDISASAIEEAKQNAQRNEIENSVFVAAPAEEVMGGMLSKWNREKDLAKCKEYPQVKKARELLQDEDCVTTAIVDPPRAGLDKRVIREIRECKAIKRLIYISCNPSGAFLEDAVKFCRKEHSKRPGEAFMPVKAMPVDLFPHTEHCELVTLFERVSAYEPKL